MNAEHYLDWLSGRTPALRKEGTVTISIVELRRVLGRAFTAGKQAEQREEEERKNFRLEPSVLETLLRSQAR
ncbi:MAG TPA: hypothetical protein VG826_29295 [Pirellulales bacterium]|nr:hypothetical protein [Pirellulales bacterium]